MVHDLSGTHRDEYFFTTDLPRSPAQVVSDYTGRWNLETTFQELRAHLGLETTRSWCRRTVLRAAPCLFGLYTVVAVLFAQLPAAQQSARVCWPGKTHLTFSDAVAAVRRCLWEEWVFPQAAGDAAVQKLPPQCRQLVLAALAPTG